MNLGRPAATIMRRRSSGLIFGVIIDRPYVLTIMRVEPGECGIDIPLHSGTYSFFIHHAAFHVFDYITHVMPAPAPSRGLSGRALCMSGACRAPIRELPPAERVSAISFFRCMCAGR